MPREIRVIEGAIQLRSQSENEPGLANEENAWVYVGALTDDAEPTYGIVLAHMSGLGPQVLDNRFGTELVIGDSERATIRRTLSFEGSDGSQSLARGADSHNARTVLYIEGSGIDPTVVQQIVSDWSEIFNTENAGPGRTGSGGNPSHSHSIPDHAHEVPQHYHFLPLRTNNLLVVNDFVSPPAP